MNQTLKKVTNRYMSFIDENLDVILLIFPVIRFYLLVHLIMMFPIHPLLSSVLIIFHVFYPFIESAFKQFLMIIKVSF